MSNSATRPTPRELHDAVLTNSLTLVLSYLEDGANPNKSPRLISSLEQELSGRDAEELSSHIRLLRNDDGPNSVSPIHVAILNCYHNTKSKETLRSDALSILQALLNAGADINAKLENMVLCHITGYYYIPVTDMKPLQLVTFLKQHLVTVYESECQTMLNKVMDKLLQASSERKLSIPMKYVPKSVSDMNKKLLFSSKYSDVCFVCPDGTQLHAHRCVLAAASPYFDTAFQGPWSETSNDDGKWPTTNSSQIIKAVLRFIYIGAMDKDLLDSDTATLLSVATEYQLEPFKQQCESKCIQKLNVNNIRKMLELAHLHNATNLKQACFAFVKKNSTAVLTDPQVMELATENSQLWSELVKAISPEESRKRQKVTP